MITFGIVSSVFDYLTFGVLLLALHATQVQFRTGWFLESVVSASLIVLVSRPGKYLIMATLSIVVVTLIVPFTPFAEIFGFSPLPFSFFLLIGIIVLFYIITAEIAKTVFYKKVKF
jgi:Mg2+-importing ATPase